MNVLYTSKQIFVIAHMATIIQNYKDYINCNFEFSEFQNDAIHGIIENNHVLVTAHTGSGKTLPAEFSIYYNIKLCNKKVIYTSPIKALSNQKYKEFSKKFPDIEIGILTGDIKHNPGADLLIMTTEILQNHCFKRNHGEKYLDFNIDLENELGSVVFDEVHYIDDPDRGTVWEQTMIMLPDNIPFVMLSATIGEKEVFAQWIENITHKKVVLCHTNHRVVPLEFCEFFSIPDKYVDNIKQKDKKEMFQNKLESKLTPVKNNQIFQKKVLNQTKKCIHELNKDGFIVHQKYVINDCLETMKNKDMFPCLMFVFSRKRVESIANQITTNLFLENEKDYNIEPIYRQMLVSKISNWKEYSVLPEYQVYLKLLEKGIGVHHAGMLPVFREIMEILYDQKYIKVLVATETFAIGLNMPTRSVIFTSLYKHDGYALRLLRSHEFIQMAGRAGRRNIDTIGYVILLTNCYEPLDETTYYNLFYSSPKILKSKFRINYNLILNFIEHYNKEECISMMKKSLMNNDILKQINISKQSIENMNNEIESLNKILQDENAISFFEEYYRIIFRIEHSKNKEKRKFIKMKNEMENDNVAMNNKQYYDDYTSLIKMNKEEQNILHYAETYVETQINNVFCILNQRGFFTQDTITQQGKNACYIHEMPCLLFIEFYEIYIKQNKLSEKDILCILSCFYDLKVKEEVKQHNPPFLKKEVDFIKTTYEELCSLELKYEFFITNQFNIQYDLMELMSKWYTNVENQNDCLFFFHEMKEQKQIFMGDFVKACLKIVAMINELRIVCENDSNYDFLEKLNNIEGKLKKYIVSNKSLYL